jgi:hypothetical protein
VDRGKDGGSNPGLLGKVLIMPRSRHEVLLYQFFMDKGEKEGFA